MCLLLSINVLNLLGIIYLDWFFVYIGFYFISMLRNILFFEIVYVFKIILSFKDRSKKKLNKCWIKIGKGFE